jgi:hypothetical protein
MSIASFQALADYINDNLVQVRCEHWTIVPAGNAVTLSEFTRRVRVAAGR